MKKKLLTAGLGIMISVCLFAGCGADASDQTAAGTDNTVAETVTEQETETQKATEEVSEVVTETETEEATEIEVYDENIITGLSTEQTDEDSLINLVKNTVVSVKSQMDYNLKETGDSVRVLSKALDSFSQTKSGAIDPNSVFDYGEEGNPFSEANAETDSWTYNDVAGSIGYFVFYLDDSSKSIDYMFTQTGEFLKEFFINDFYHADENNFSDFELAGATNEYFSPSKDSMEINYKLQFKYNGQIYTALIGNMNESYKVLDIVKGSKITSSKSSSNSSTNKFSNKNNANNSNNTSNKTATTNNSSDNNPVPESVAPVVNDESTNEDNGTVDVPVETPNTDSSDPLGLGEGRQDDPRANIDYSQYGEMPSYEDAMNSQNPNSY